MNGVSYKCSYCEHAHMSIGITADGMFVCLCNNCDYSHLAVEIPTIGVHANKTRLLILLARLKAAKNTKSLSIVKL